MASKIQDVAEVIRWFNEGRTYRWMTEEYERKYNLVVSPSLWGNFRRRMGLPRRINRDDDLIPWLVAPEHRSNYAVQMLRAEARLRRGIPLTGNYFERLEAWKAKLAADDLVVHYEPETERGFFYVPRRIGVDNDLIREPEEKTTHQRPVD